MSSNGTALGPWWKEPNKGQWLSFGAAWLGWVLDAFDFTIFLLAMPAIAAEFGVSYTATASSITLTLLLRLLGGLVAGWAADRWGRKLPLMLSIIWFALCDGAVAFAPSFAWVLVLRTLFGFGMGAEWTSGAALAMENWPARSRGIASGILQGSWGLGYLLAAVVSSAVLPTWGWRALFALAVLPALLAFAIRAWVPESPEWQAGKRQRRAQAGATGAQPLPRAEVARRLVWASVFLGLGLAMYYGLTGLYPTMLKVSFGFDAARVGTLVSLFNIGMLVGAVTSGWIAARRSVLLAIAVPSVLLILSLPLYVGQVPALLPLGALAGGMFGAGISGITPLLLTTLFPAELRARAMGFVYHVGAFGAAFVPTGIAALHDYAGWPFPRAILWVVATAEVLLLLTLLFRPRAITGPTGTGK